ncbi:MAG: hypothetical protein HY368_01830 [Candidatus Aenigmarchaeota archaeon]|nr:hypothetical protein [Candidatus Aenigmarchaeota archaeon]
MLRQIAVISLLIVPAVLVSGCTSTGLSISLFCKPDWQKQGVFVLDDAQGWQNCKNYCAEKYQTGGHKIEREGVSYSCYCDINKCS